ncbi:MAG: 2OG-Fe(II) oxygenase [Sphingomonas sp.]
MILKSLSDSTGAYPPAPVFQAPIRIGRDGTKILADTMTTTDIRHALAAHGGAVFHDVMDPDLLESLQEVASRAPFRQVDLKEYGLRGNDLSAQSALPFCVTLARPALMRWLEQISGCEPVSHIEGHLVQMVAGNSLGWHSDAGLGIRRLALVVNLTTAEYEGGDFELRHRDPYIPMLTYHAGARGSLAVFRLAQDLEHQVTRVLSGGPRTTFSGWARGPSCSGDAVRGGALTTWPPLAPCTRA